MAEMGAPISLDGLALQIVGVYACVIFILHQKIQKMVKCTFCYQLTWVVLDKVQRAVKWLCVCAFVRVCVRNQSRLVFSMPLSLLTGKSAAILA